MKTLQNFTLILILIFTVGCGFHFRDTVQLPETAQPIWVDGQQKHPFIKQLKEIVKNSGNILADSEQEAKTVIEIFNETQQQRQISVGTDAYAREYELTLLVRYQIHYKDKKIVPPRTIQVTRNYDYQGTGGGDFVVGKDREKNLLEQEMRRELAGRLLTQVQRSYTDN